MLREAHRTYSRWLNLCLHRCGHVWQNRYFSCPLIGLSWVISVTGVISVTDFGDGALNHRHVLTPDGYSPIHSMERRVAVTAFSSFSHRRTF